MSGFVVSSMKDALVGVKKLGRLKGGLVQQEFERRFTVHNMVGRYAAIYEQLGGRALSRSRDGRCASLSGSEHPMPH